MWSLIAVHPVHPVHPATSLHHFHHGRIANNPQTPWGMTRNPLRPTPFAPAGVPSPNLFPLQPPATTPASSPPSNPPLLPRHHLRSIFPAFPASARTVALRVSSVSTHEFRGSELDGDFSGTTRRRTTTEKKEKRRRRREIRLGEGVIRCRSMQACSPASRARRTRCIPRRRRARRARARARMSQQRREGARVVAVAAGRRSGGTTTTAGGRASRSNRISSEHYHPLNHHHHARRSCSSPFFCPRLEPHARRGFCPNRRERGWRGEWRWRPSRRSRSGFRQP